MTGQTLEKKVDEVNFKENGAVKKYTREDAFNGAINYFKGDKLAADAWTNKYALKDSEDNFYENSPDQMHRRLVSEISRIEKKYPNSLKKEKIYSLLKDFKYLVPQGGPMTGIGNNYQVSSLSNCFVIGYPNADAYGGIMKVDEEQVQLMKRRGGVGHDLSHIRPAGSSVNNSALTSTGVVPFMERYSNSTREVAQDGRRGALMLSIDIDHPDSGNFIDAKLEQGKITGANISVKINDEFMKAVVENKKYIQKYPVGSENPKITKEINAKELWDKIIHNAWKSAEPGVLFWDTVTRESIPDRYSDFGYKTISTNPCGEIPLCPYDSCRLLAVNLYSYVDKPFTKEANFNWYLFKEHSGYAQRIMDDIVDLESEKIERILEKIDSDPEPESIKRTERELWENILHKTNEGRRTGVGITAEGDMLAALGIRYGTDESINFSEKVHKTLAIEAYRSSVNMAKERGKFEIYDSEREKDNPFIQRIKEADPALYEEMVRHGRRNIALLTIAPTGTTSLMTQTTSGIEPAFLTSYKRKRKVNPNDKNVRVDFVDKTGDSWEEYNVFHHKFEDWLRINNHDIEEVKNLDEKDLQKIVEQSPYYKATANDVDWVKKVELQGKVQKWVDHSISVTVNIPEDTSEEMVSKIYETGWKAGCKGITVYREGSRDGILTSGNLEEKITLIQRNVKPHPILEIKPQAIKYKVKRYVYEDSLHIIPTSDLYVDDKHKKAYFIPVEDFQIRAPLGTATTVSFAQSGMDRTEILRGPNPNYAELVTRWQSASSNEEEGIGTKRIKSIEHAVGVAFEDYLTRNGVIERAKETGQLVNLIRKIDLRKVEKGTEEYNSIITQVRVGDETEELVIGGNGKRDAGTCPKCGDRYIFSEGCMKCSCGSKCE